MQDTQTESLKNLPADLKSRSRHWRQLRGYLEDAIELAIGEWSRDFC